MEKVEIKKDAIGPYIVVGGWYARPYNTPDPMNDFKVGTDFNVGDLTEGHHFCGSQRVGVKKIDGRGKYQEYWHTTDLEHKCLGESNNIVDELKVKPKKFLFW